MILAGPQTIMIPSSLIAICMLVVMCVFVVLFYGVRLFIRKFPNLAGIAVRLGVLVLVSSLTLFLIQFYITEFAPERRAAQFKEGLIWALLIPSPIYVPLLLAPLAVWRKDPNSPSH